MRTVDAVLFDKTGTLTKGEHAVTGVAAVDGLTEDRPARAGRPPSRPTANIPLARAIVGRRAGPGRRCPPPRASGR